MKGEPQLEYPTARASHPPEETFRVLFLDSRAQIERLKGACKDVGYVVVGTETIEEAMTFLAGKDHVDVIVCAAHLENESAFAFLQHVRAHPTHGKTMFLLLSIEPGAVGARLDRSAAQAGRLLGADAYTIMPVFDACTLVAQIREMQPAVPTLQLSATEEEKRRSE